MTKETEVKYVVAGTDEEVLLGDVICVDMVKDFKDGRTLTREVEFKITEEIIPEALELGIIEEVEDEKEDKNDEDLLDFGDDGCPFKELLDEIVEDQEDHDRRIETLESQVKVLKTLIDHLVKKNTTKGKKQSKPEDK